MKSFPFNSWQGLNCVSVFSIGAEELNAGAINRIKPFLLAYLMLFGVRFGGS